MAKKKKSKEDIVKKTHEYRAIGNSFKAKGKLTTGMHFEQAAEIIEELQETIAELEAG